MYFGEASELRHHLIVFTVFFSRWHGNGGRLGVFFFGYYYCTRRPKKKTRRRLSSQQRSVGRLVEIDSLRDI